MHEQELLDLIDTAQRNGYYHHLEPFVKMLAKIRSIANNALPQDSAEHYNALRDIMEVFGASDD